MLTWQKRFLASSLVLVAGCTAPAGDFCDVVGGPILFAPDTSAIVVATDRGTAEAISVLNDYGAGACRW